MLAELKGWGQVAVGTRMNDRCDPQFFNCWSHLIAGGLRKGDTVLDAGIELPQHMAGNVLALHFLASDADSLLMVDTDMIFKQDTLNRLRDDVAGQEYDVLSALSVTRREPYYPILLRLDPAANNGNGAYVCAKDAINGSVIPVDSVGTGFTLIRRKVFDDMAAKLEIGGRWFFDWGPCGLGEDTQFCQRAIKLGFRVGVHTGIGIGHRGPITFVWDAEQKKTTLETSHQCKELMKP